MARYTNKRKGNQDGKRSRERAKRNEEIGNTFDGFKEKPTVVQKQTTPPKLKAYIRDLLNPDKRLVFVDGLPSTGKTKCAIENGLKLLRRGKYDKLITVRPVVIPETGYLPGALLEKMYPYIRQAAIYADMCTQEGFDQLIATKRIEVLSADLLQGDRFQNCFVVFDEMQNVHQDKTFAILSRAGEGAKFVCIGDTSKGQRSSKVKKQTMLRYCIENFANDPYASVHTFHDIDNDILGDDFTKHIIKKLAPDFVAEA